MSVAESGTSTAPAARPSYHRPSTRFLRSELRLIFLRRRNLAGLLVLAGVPVLISIAVKATSSHHQRGGPDFFSSITDNGLFVSLASLSLEIGLFLPLAVAAISGDSVAGEANIGTLRYLLTVPVQRSRLLLVKYLAIVIFSLAATFTVTVTGVVMGLALFGGGDLTLLSGTQIGFLEGLGRVVLASLYISACLASLGAVGLFLSTLTEQPIGAMIAVVLINVMMYALDSISQLSWLHPWLLTHWATAFGDLLRTPIFTENVTRGLLVALVYAVVFWCLAWARFSNKDVSS
jgi:ABC-2 type transport system permease protein